MSDDSNDKKRDEEDQVAEAYENISKKLDSLRKGEKDDEQEERPEESDDPKEPDEEAEDEIAEDDDKPLDPLPGTGDGDDSDDEPKPTFTPSRDDPLDNEDDEEESGETDTDTAEDIEDLDKPTGKPSPKEENLDDLAEDTEDSGEQIPHLKPSQKESALPQRDGGYGSDISFSKPSYTEPHPSNYFNRHSTERPPRRGNIWHLIILILIGLAVIGGTVYLLKYQFGTTAPAPTPTPVPTQEPTPEPTPAFDRSKFKIRVLNGTTKAGLAKETADKLKELGYQIERTGNAPKQDFAVTQIKTKSDGVTGLADQLKQDLGSSEASVSSDLKDSDASDAEVIIGTK